MLIVPIASIADVFAVILPDQRIVNTGFLIKVIFTPPIVLLSVYIHIQRTVDATFGAWLDSDISDRRGRRKCH